MSIFNLNKKVIEPKIQAFDDLAVSRIGEMARKYAQSIDQLFLEYFKIKGLPLTNKTFKHMKRVIHNQTDQREEFFFKGELIITIFPYKMREIENGMEAVMDYKLHYKG